MGAAYFEKGSLERAVPEFQKAGWLGQPRLAYVYARSSSPAEARKILDRLKALPQPPPYSVALIYAGLGSRDEAFAWLDRAYRERAFGLVNLELEPQLDSLHSDPRFAALLQRLGLPP